MTIDDALAVFKEIVYMYSVPVTLHISSARHIEMRVPKSHADIPMQHEIKELARKRGMKSSETPLGLFFYN